MNFVPKLLAIVAGLCVATSQAQATAVTLDFDQLNGGTDGAHFEEVLNFYAGGSGSLGTGPGPNYGITVAGLGGISHAAAPVFAFCNTESCSGNRGVAGAPSGPNSMLIFGNASDGAGAILNVSGGFSGTVEFDAATTDTANFRVKTDASNPSAIVNSRINNAGVDRSSCPPTLGVTCPFVHYSISFEGLAHTIVFDTSFRGPLSIDNLHFSNLTLPPGADDGGVGAGVPEPASWALMISGFGLAGAALRRNRRTLAAT